MDVGSSLFSPLKQTAIMLQELHKELVEAGMTSDEAIKLIAELAKG